jgi:hypothetical protein
VSIHGDLCECKAEAVFEVVTTWSRTPVVRPCCALHLVNAVREVSTIRMSPELQELCSPDEVTVRTINRD